MYAPKCLNAVSYVKTEESRAGSYTSPRDSLCPVHRRGPRRRSEPRNQVRTVALDPRSFPPSFPESNVFTILAPLTENRTRISSRIGGDTLPASPEFLSVPALLLSSSPVRVLYSPRFASSHSALVRSQRTSVPRPLFTVLFRCIALRRYIVKYHVG